MERKYKISIIMAVYNVEQFVAESIESVIAQDMGFENIQLILVDDGSKDNSLEICRGYAEKYPQNIVLIHKENGGVSSARNEGLKHVQGEYVNFLDSDDLLTPDTCRLVYDFLCQHSQETDMAVIPLFFFDGQTGPHPLNNKFNRGTRVINLERDWNCPQLSLSCAFTRRECFENLQFDTGLSYAEDGQVALQILMNKLRLGVVKEAQYMYRKRTVGAPSAIQASGTTAAWYLPYIRRFSLFVLERAMERLGYVPKFIQGVVMYDLQWRLRMQQPEEKILPQEYWDAYVKDMGRALSYIDDDVIMEQRNIFREHKYLAMQLKYGDMGTVYRRENELSIGYRGRIYFRVSDYPVRLEFISLEQDSCTLEGGFYTLEGLEQELELKAAVNGQLYPCTLFHRRAGEKALGRAVQNSDAFRVTIPLTGGVYTLRFFCCHGDGMIPLSSVMCGSFFPVSREYASSYYVKNGWKLQCSPDGLVVSACNAAEARQAEIAFLKELWKKNKDGGRTGALARVAVKFLKAFRRKPLWLVSDRVMKAGDNGEALFRHLQQYRNVDARFVLDKRSPNYAQMKKVGRVVPANTYWYKLALLMSQVLISSSAEVEFYNPFNGYSSPYRSLLADIPFVFLQHGVTKDDQSRWLQKSNKNLAGFITSGMPEYESIIHGNYEYTEKQVWLTGMPRFDRLYRQDEKWITIMPTWRRYLMSGWDAKDDYWQLKPGAENSQYIQFYRDLLNDPRLLAKAKELGYRLKFLPHPNLQTHLDLFNPNPDVDFLGRETSYRDIYARSSLVVTDYSSAVFDFAYLRQPVVYTQFDAQEFFAGEHVYEKGYFEYERDGFGEVEYTLQDTIDRIIDYMERGCQLKEEYRQRIDGFFAFNDQNNSQRVYEKLLELTEGTKA